MVLKPEHIDDTLWREINHVLKQYESEVKKIVNSSIGANSFYLSIISDKFSKSLSYSNIWSVIEIYYPHLISTILDDNINENSIKRDTVASYYIAVLEIAYNDGITEPEMEAYNITFQEYEDEFTHYIEQYPSFIDDAKSAFFKMRSMTDNI